MAEKTELWIVSAITLHAEGSYSVLRIRIGARISTTHPPTHPLRSLPSTSLYLTLSMATWGLIG